MKFDLSDALIAVGLGLVGVGLWMTVGWWALVVCGAVLLAAGIMGALARSPSR